MEPVRVLLVIESPVNKELLQRICLAEAPDVELIPLTDESGEVVNSNDPIELMTAAANADADVLVHWTLENIPAMSLYEWLVNENPFLRIVHIGCHGRFCVIQRKLVVSKGVQPSLRSLLDAIRNRCSEIAA